MFEAAKGHLGGDGELAVVDASLALRREAWAGSNNLEAVTPQMVALMVRERVRSTRSG